MTGLGDIRLYEAIGRMRETADQLQEERDQLKAENARLKQELEAVGTAAYLYGRTDIADENAKLREQTELLVTLLRNDCDIEASWDGLRHFWSIGLTENGCLMRDRACKAEAENAKLVKLIDSMIADYMIRADDYYSIMHTIHCGKRGAYKPNCDNILARIGETYDGIKINGYLDQMKELRHEL